MNANRLTPARPSAPSRARGATPALLAAASAALVLACHKPPPAAPLPPPPGQTSAPAPWVKVRPGLGIPLYEAPAQVLSAPGSVAEIMAPLRAQVLAIQVRPGQRVAALAPLLTVLMPEVVRAAFAYQGAGLRLLAYGQRREQLLQLKSEGLMRLAELAETEARIAEARATQLEAQALLHVAGIAPTEAAALGSREGRVVLRSPIAGVVTSVSAALGQVADGGGPLVRVAGSSEPRIEARLPPTLPDRVSFELVLPGGSRRPLRLIERAPLVDSRDGTALAWLVPVGPLGSAGDPGSPAAAAARPTGASAALPAAGTPGAAAAAPGAEEATAAVAAELPAGLTAKLQVSLPERAAGGPATGGVLVPARALLLREGRPYVIRRREPEPQQVEVRVLLVTGADALVSPVGASALQPGDEIAADAGPYSAGEAGEP
jgi:biotin carboxyl carrier protein